jgi:hypothetical protein
MHGPANILSRLRPAAIAGSLAVLLTTHTAASQSVGALEPAPAKIRPAAKPMTPARVAWLKGRCSQLVAYYDYYGVTRGEHSDGARNHTRIAAVIECERADYRHGIDTMAALLVRKAFIVPTPGTPAVEPEDLEAPDIESAAISATGR